MLNGSMTDHELEKNFEWNSYGLTEVLFWYVPGGTEKTKDPSTVKFACRCTVPDS
jgi:hypothetical protein